MTGAALAGDDIVGPGTLTTSGTTTVSSNLTLDGGVTWNNAGVVNDSASIYSMQDQVPQFEIVNLAGAIFDVGAIAYVGYYDRPLFANSVTLVRTGGSSTRFNAYHS